MAQLTDSGGRKGTSGDGPGCGTQNLQNSPAVASQKLQRGDAANRAIRSYQDLLVWQRAMTLAELCYCITRKMSTGDLFALGIAIRRSAVSIASNIAEGHNRRGRRTYRNHVGIAMGSQAELETQLELGRRVGTITPADSERTLALALAAEVGRLLFRLREALKR